MKKINTLNDKLKTRKIFAICSIIFIFIICVVIDGIVNNTSANTAINSNTKVIKAAFFDAKDNAYANYNLKVADTAKKRAQGLMYVKDLKENEGMIFVYPDDIVMTFWMKNTYIPLDIVFLDKNYFVVGIIENMIPQGGKNIDDNDIPRYSINKSSRFAIEIPAFSAKKYGIKEGDRLGILK